LSKITKGTPDQLLNAVMRQIDVLEDSNDITSTQTIEASQDNLFKQLYDCWGEGQDFEAFKDDIIDTYNSDVSQGAFEGSLDEYLEDELEELKADGYISASSYFDPDAVKGLDDMTIGEMTRFLYAYWQSKTDDPEAVDYYGYDKHLGECYQSEYEDDFTGSYDDYLKERCEDAIADGFELTDEFIQSVNDARREVAEVNGINSTTNVNSTTSVAEVLDFLSSKGYDAESEEVKNYAEGVASYIDLYDDSEQPYTLDQWYKDTMQNYPEDLKDLPQDVIDSATNTVNVACATDELTPAQVDDLWNIADSFVTSDPVSGDWGTETAAEQQYIADHFDCSLEQAKQYMINYLGFEPDDSSFIEGCDQSAVVEGATADTANHNEEKADLVTYDVVQAAEDADNDYNDDDDYDEDNNDSYINLIGDKLNKWAVDGTVGSDNYAIDSILLDDGDDENLYITLTYENAGVLTIVEYELPIEDLTFADVDEDFNHIVDEIQSTFDEED